MRSNSSWNSASLFSGSGECIRHTGFSSTPGGAWCRGRPQGCSPCISTGQCPCAPDPPPPQDSPCPRPAILDQKSSTRWLVVLAEDADTAEIRISSASLGALGVSAVDLLHDQRRRTRVSALHDVPQSLPRSEEHTS